ncbi:hypothetical protein HBI56_226690 [Parastagonospora nodorum]|uniref:RRM domain-containing protein n=1 Tax=Phaeosphaeria nodorum (strain SN15 / ATCC MYA-4574 / FGSC 10173) TaxID=321614 RepID=Q0TX64_PHANO|nr:hypothetical protein SNOG_15877 [Parastagonospora nodorum SN15]KAH3904850.1 hypothetical protein HBH56_226850 [Parastagonospora nodorum]EAT76715.1 hypothetical protein SNOG_15877 [Parastagonospora nodorum SN15]KAH3921739.1 hypothetical protein HBH54_235960 [Parastagonospora nodorum]KAH3959108.1 hypothetical protein HBH51_202730 [Parastagonospora nodorum]KAH4042612.1 hypothetical protein HBH49_246570 [Parastagonospora nodorum]
MQPQHSLPARPPPSTYSAPPSRPNHPGARGQSNPSMYGGFTPRSVAAHAPPQAGPSALYSQPTVSTPYQATAYASSNAYYDNSYPAYAAAAPTPSYPAAPPMNSAAGGTYDPEEEARIAEWNSAYNKDDAAFKKGISANVGARTDAVATPDAEPAVTADGKRKTVVREGGGKTWEDPTLLEWDPMHPRLFIGNLAGEVTDDSLHKAFSKYPSLVKARVVRDKKSTKSKSYGFVSFSDTDDYFRAFKEMNGKYIGSHPVKLSRATSEVKAVIKKEDKHHHHGKNNKNNKNNKNQTNRPSAVASAPVAPNPVAFIPRGVQKKGKSAGPRLLG